MRHMNKFPFLLFALAVVQTGCDSNTTSDSPGQPSSSGSVGRNGSGSVQSYNGFVAGRDFQEFERVRLLDKVGFTEPQEAYSILLPTGWSHEGGIGWNNPGTACAGTFSQLKAASPDGRFEFRIYPEQVYGWNTDPELRAMQQGNNGNNCATREPMDAETYLREIFSKELDNPEIVKVETNNAVIDQMRQMNDRVSAEMRQYGAGQMDYTQTAINATVRWKDGREGLVTLGANTVATTVPNMYTGTSNQVFTTSITRRTLFKYPATEKETAGQQLSVIMSSIRTNNAWADAVNDFWRKARQQSHVVHVGKIRMMDEQTRRMGEQAIRNGQQRLNDMDNQMRSWEQRQSANDRMHTEFIKTIREVENFRDETGKYEMSAGYEKVWSRGDGNHFILSNNDSFDPASVFQDQNWKEMRKAE